MKKLFANLIVICMLASGMTAFAADEPASAEDRIIEHEAQGEVMPIAEVGEDVPAAEGDMIIEHEAQGEVMPIDETEENVPAAESEATEEAPEVVIDFAAIAKDAIVIEGEKVAIAGGMGTLIEKDGVIFVPVRVALEAAGYQVSWADKEQMVMGANQATGAMFIMQLDNTLLFYLTADGEEGKLTMEAAPFKNEEEWRTYVPLKAMAKALGYKVGVDEAETVIVTLSK